MDEPLHPSSLSEILDRTAQIYRARFLVLLGIAIVPTVTLSALAGGLVLFLLRWGSASAGLAHAESRGFEALTVVGAFLFVVLPAVLGITALASAAMCHAASRIFLGKPVTIRASYQAVWRQAFRFASIYASQLLAAWLLPTGAWFALFLLAPVSGTLTRALGNAGGLLFLFAGFLSIVGLFAFALWMALRLSLAFPAAVAEQIGIWAALRRSGMLARGAKGRILLLYLLGLALHWLLAIAITFPLVLVTMLIPNANSPQHEQVATVILLFILYGSAFAAHALTRPVYGIALTLFYYDQRIRHEGFDIEWMMLRAGLTTASIVTKNFSPQAESDTVAGESTAQTSTVNDHSTTMHSMRS